MCRGGANAAICSTAGRCGGTAPCGPAGKGPMAMCGDSTAASAVQADCRAGAATALLSQSEGEDPPPATSQLKGPRQASAVDPPRPLAYMPTTRQQRCTARVRATYTRRRFSAARCCASLALMACSSPLSGTRMSSTGWPASSWYSRPSPALPVDPPWPSHRKGQNTSGYSRPLDLWMVTICTRLRSDARRSCAASSLRPSVRCA